MAVRWGTFALSEPQIAALGRRILAKYGLAYLATVTGKGHPRLHPVCPALIGDGLYLGVVAESPKRHDLDRTGRYSLHGLPGPGDAEFAVCGAAKPLSDALVADLRATAGPRVKFHPTSVIYELLLSRAWLITYDRTAGPDPKPVKLAWMAGQAEPRTSRGAA